MKDKEILEKAIRKAIDGGWKPFVHRELENFFVWDHCASTFSAKDGKDLTYSVSELIYKHDFAKALWGIEKKPSTCALCGYFTDNDSDKSTCAIDPWGFHEWTNTYTANGYRYHLQQMVVSEDPIKYLGKHI